MDAFSANVVAVMPDLKRWALRLTSDASKANDLTQDTVEKALRARDRFQEGTNLKAWLFTIMRNIRINGVRRDRLGSALDIDDPDVHLPPVPASADMVVDAKACLRAMDRMPKHQRDLLLMIGDGMQYDEIAMSLGCPLGTVKSKVNRARTVLASFGAGGNDLIDFMLEAAE